MVDRPNFEPTAADTVRILESDVRFARAMSFGKPGTIGLTLAILVVFMAVAVVVDLWAARLRIPPQLGELRYEVVAVLGAKCNGLIDHGQLWRFGSSMLLHGGALHVAMNGYSLWILGKLLEPFYGLRRFLLLFCLSGFAGAYASYQFTPGPSVGASGAIFGLLGAALVFGYKNKDVLPPRLRRGLTIGLLPWIGFYVVLGQVVPKIDNAAHMGGLIGGAVVALTFGTALKNDKFAPAVVLQWVLLVASLGYLVLSAFMAAGYMADCGQTMTTLNTCLIDIQR